MLCVPGFSSLREAWPQLSTCLNLCLPIGRSRKAGKASQWTLSSLLPHPHTSWSPSPLLVDNTYQLDTWLHAPLTLGTQMIYFQPHSMAKHPHSYAAPLGLLRGREEWHPLNVVRTLSTMKPIHNRLGTEHCWVCDFRGTIYILTTVGFHWPTGCRSSVILHSSANFCASDRFGV